MEEVWKGVAGYEDDYEVSTSGRIRRWYSTPRPRALENPKYIKPQRAANDYIVVSLSKNNKKKSFYVHRLVAEAFIDEVPEKPQVNHIDFNKQNNHVTNLEWVDNAANQVHSYNNDPNRKRPTGQQNWKLRKNNKTEECKVLLMDLIEKDIANGLTQEESCKKHCIASKTYRTWRKNAKRTR